MTFGACRAYFRLKGLTAGDLAQGINGILLNFGDGEGTGIRALENGEWKMENEAGVWYDLSGRRLSGKPTVRGIYVNKGKKIVIK